jgi:phosphatidylserine decarboxylase
MSMDRAGWPFVLGFAVPAVITWIAGWTWLAAIFVLLTLFMAFFFRDPSRIIPVDPLAIVSPADGRVMIAGAVELDAAPPGDWVQVSVFLSPINVHMNRVPIGGRVTKVLHTPGEYLAAYRRESATRNERNEIWISHEGQTVVCRQIVGVLARRLVCRVREGQDVETGQKYGLMKFGSRIDLFLPASARLDVKVGQSVRGGETVIARCR